RAVSQGAGRKRRDELVVLHWVDGDAAVAPSEHAVIFGAESGGGVPVRVEDPLKWRRVVDVAVVRGNALEDDDDHVSINGPVIAVHNRLVVIHHFGMRG